MKAAAPGFRWMLAALALVIALIVALWPRGEDAPSSVATPTTSASQPAPDDAAGVAAPAGLVRACPPVGAAEGALSGVAVDCLATGQRVDLASITHGTPTVLNMWAYWCGPCKTEMPHLRDYAARTAGRVNVLTVHADPNVDAAFSWLADQGIDLPGVEDRRGAVRAAVGAPPVLPVTVMVRADGTIAAVLPKPFDSEAAIADAVHQYLGVTA